jgi:hypothetical protein
MLPSFRRRREHIAAVFSLLLPFAAEASPTSVLSTAEGSSIMLPADKSGGDAERELHWGLLALEASALDYQGQASSELVTGDLRRADFVQSFYVEPGPTPSLVMTSTTLAEPIRRETLRQVLRSVATTHRFQQQQPRGLPQGAHRERSAPSDETSDDTERRGLAELLLDSEIVGAMARSLVEIRTADGDGAIFSFLGLGDFVLDVTPSVHAAVLTELSSGLSVGTPLAGDYSFYSNYGFSGIDSRMPREKVNVLRLMWDWVVDIVFSPVGVLASMVTGIVLFLWLSMKSVSLLQRRASR